MEQEIRTDTGGSGLMSNACSSHRFPALEKVRKLPQAFAKAFAATKQQALKVSKALTSDKVLGGVLLGATILTSLQFASAMSLTIGTGIVTGAYGARKYAREIFQNIKHRKGRDAKTNRANTMLAAGQWLITAGIVGAANALFVVSDNLVPTKSGVSETMGILMEGMIGRIAKSYADHLEGRKRPIPLEQVDPKSRAAFERGHEIMTAPIEAMDKHPVLKDPLENLMRIAQDTSKKAGNEGLIPQADKISSRNFSSRGAYYHRTMA